MALKKLVGKDGYLHILTFGSDIESGELQKGKWYKIKSKATVSALPEGSRVGDLYPCFKEGVTLASGDVVKEVTFNKVGFATDISKSQNKEKFDVTTQIDKIKAFRSSVRVESSGSINGYFTLGDPSVKEILGQFFATAEVGSDGVVEYKPIKSETIHFILGRNETNTVGDTEIFEYMPCILDSLSADKPMDGAQPFNVNYTLDGSECPMVFERVVTA